MNEQLKDLAFKAGISVEYLINTKQLPVLELFATLVASAEREACAKLCDAKYEEYPDEEQDLAHALSAKELASAIRARGQA